MKQCQYLLLLIFLHTAQVATAQSNNINYTIAPWLNNKKAALSLTFDDAINGQFTVALPMLNSYGFRATFFIITSFIQPQLKSWQPVIEAARSGHEIASHTVTHPFLHKTPPDSIHWQFAEGNKIIATEVKTAPGMPTLAYPYGDGGNATDSERLVRTIAQQYFTGARATRNNTLPYNTYHFAQAIDDYYKVNSDMIADSASVKSFAEHLDEAIQAGGWYVPTYHGIENGWIIVKKTAFANHLSVIDARKNDIWIAPFGEVLKYHKERNCATLQVVSNNKRTLTLALSDTLMNDTTYNQPVTINLTRNKYSVVKIEQAGKPLPFTQQGNMVCFNAVPGKQPIAITKR